MATQLMAATGFGGEFEQRVAAAWVTIHRDWQFGGGESAEMRDGVLEWLVGFCTANFVVTSSDRMVDQTGGVGMTAHDGEIAFGDMSIGEGGRQRGGGF